MTIGSLALVIHWRKTGVAISSIRPSSPTTGHCTKSRVQLHMSSHLLGKALHNRGCKPHLADSALHRRGPELNHRTRLFGRLSQVPLGMKLATSLRGQSQEMSWIKPRSSPTQRSVTKGCHFQQRLTSKGIALHAPTNKKM